MENFNQRSNPHEGKNAEGDPSIEKLEKFLGAAQQELAREGINVDGDLRILHAVQASVTNADDDEEKVKKSLLAFYGTNDLEKIREIEKKKKSSQFEMLKTAIMYKNMKSDYIVVRSSRYDDIQNKVDNVLVNRKTGTTICAIDELYSGKNITTDPEYLKKKNEIYKINFGIDRESETRLGMKQSERTRDPGAKLKYGLVLNEDKFEVGPVNHIPAFLLPIDRAHLEEGLNKFDPKMTSNSQEKLLLKFFTGVITSQINEMRLNQKDFAALPADFKKRIEDFEEYIKAANL